MEQADVEILASEITRRRGRRRGDSYSTESGVKSNDCRLRGAYGRVAGGARFNEHFRASPEQIGEERRVTGSNRNYAGSIEAVANIAIARHDDHTGTGCYSEDQKSHGSCR